MGAGHIGSTIFDIALSTHPHIESLGEIRKFHNFGWIDDKNRKCACGSSVYECVFWARVRQIWADKVGEKDGERYIYLQKKIEGSRIGWVRFFLNKMSPVSALTEYNQMTEALYSAVQEISGKCVGSWCGSGIAAGQ